MLCRTLILLILSIALFGCASQPQAPIRFDSSAFEKKEKKIGIVMSAVPRPSLSLPGADCLLCIAVASAANSGLSAHVKTLSNKEVGELKQALADRFTEQSKDVVLISSAINISTLPKVKSEVPNTAKKDFSEFSQQNGVDQLLVVDIQRLGAIRSYASYIPTSDPMAHIIGEAYIVDAKTNTYTWFMPIEIHRSSEGMWKEPPEYPGLTNAYYQLLDNLRDSLLEPFES